MANLNALLAGMSRYRYLRAVLLVLVCTSLRRDSIWGFNRDISIFTESFPTATIVENVRHKHAIGASADIHEPRSAHWGSGRTFQPLSSVRTLPLLLFIRHDSHC